MNFSERLINLRKSKGLSQDELGKQIGVSLQSISKWELGTAYPDFTRLVNLSDYYGIILDELVKGISVQDVRDRNKTELELSEIHDSIIKGRKYLKILPFGALFCVVALLMLAYLNGGF